MEEQTFFEYETVKITNARFVVDGQTFAMSNVTSVAPLEQPPKRFWLALLLVIGIASLLSNPFFGIPIIAIAAYMLYKQKTMYHVMLRTSGGETKALSTDQKDYLNKVVEALNNAIIHRG